MGWGLSQTFDGLGLGQIFGGLEIGSSQQKWARVHLCARFVDLRNLQNTLRNF